MGKQNKNTQFLSQEEFDNKLNSSIDTLIDKGTSDADIKFFIEDFKTQFSVKKKEDTTSVSEVGESATPTIQNTPITESTQPSGESDLQKPKRFNIGSLEERKLTQKSSSTNFKTTSKSFPKKLSIEDIESFSIDLPKPTENELEIQQAKEKLGINKVETNFISDIDVEPLLERHEQVRNNPEDVLEVEKQIEDEKNGDFGFLDKATRFTKRLFGLPSSAIEGDAEDRLKEIDEERKLLAKQRNVDKESIPYNEAENSFYEKRKKELIRKKGDNRIREFNEELTSDEQKALENHFEVNFFDLKLESKKKLVRIDRLKKERENLLNEFKEIDQTLKSREENFDGTLNNPQSFFEENKKLASRQTEIFERINKIPEEISDNFDQFSKIEEDVLSVENEVDLYKRNYNDTLNALGKFGASAGDFLVNLQEFSDKYIPSSILGRKIGDALGFDTTKKNEEARLRIRETTQEIRDNLRRPIELDDINASNFVDWAMDLTSEQSINVIVLASTGGAGTAIIGASSAGAKSYDMEQEEKLSNGDVQYNTVQKMFVPLLFGTAEALSERISLGQINKMKRAFKSASPNVLKRDLQTYFKDNYKEYFTDALTEGGSEALSQFSQNLVDRYFLGKDIALSEGLSESFVSGAFMSGVIFKMPALTGDLRRGFTSKDTNQKLGELSDKLIVLSKELKNKDISEESKNAIIERQNKLVQEQQDLLVKSAENLDNLSEDSKKELLDIETERYNLRKKYDEVNRDSSLTSEVKKELLSNIDNDIKNIISKKEEILQKPLENEKQEKVQPKTETKEEPITETKQAEEEVLEPTSESTVSDNTKTFVDKLGGKQEDISDIISGATKVGLGDTDVILMAKGDNIKIESISTPKSKRGQGSGRSAINEVIKVADSQNKTLELNVVPLDDTTNAEQLVDFYESVGFVKEDNFNIDGGVMTRQPNTNNKIEETNSENDIENITEESDGFEGIDSILNEELNPQPFIAETNKNKYEVSVQNGELNISPRLGNETPSRAELNKITEQYLQGKNFDEGKRVDFSDKGNLEQSQISDLIASESQNAVEIAQELQRVKSEQAEVNDAESLDKKGAIAQALQSVQVNRDSFAKVDDANNISDINPFYFSSRNKNITGEDGNIDNIRERAEQFTDQEVSLQDIVNFIKENRNPNNIESENTITGDLEIKFKELTGLNATDSNINAVADFQSNIQETDSDTDNEVPFQTQSNQTKIAGEQLSNLVSRLLKTGLAKDVKVLSNNQIKNLLENLGIYNVQSQINFNFKEISNTEVSSDTLNSVRTSLRRSYPDSTTLQILDAIQRNNIDSLESFELQEFAEYVLDNGLTFQNLSNMLIQDDIVVSTKSAITKILNIGERGRNIENYIRFQKELSDKGVLETPNGFVHDGIVYLNQDKVKADTPIHEFGHLWNAFVKENNPDVYSRGLELIENSEYHEQVINNEAYNHLSDEGKLEEALAQAIGEKGVKIQSESKKSKFSNWFKSLFQKIARGLGLRNISSDKLSNLTLDQYTDLASAEILSGRNITGRETKQSKNKVDDSGASNIDAVIEQEESLLQQKKRLTEKFKNKEAFNKDAQNELIDYINQVIDSKKKQNIQPRDFNKLLTLVKNPKSTFQQLKKAFEKVDDISKNIENTIQKNREKEDELRQIAENKSNNFAKRKKALIDYINLIIDSKQHNESRIGEFKKILNEVKKEKFTENNFIKSIDKINNIGLDIGTRILQKKFLTILNRNFSVNQSGRTKASNITDNQGFNIFKTAKNIIKSISDYNGRIKESLGKQRLNNSEKQTALQNLFNDNLEEIVKLNSKENLSEQEQSELIGRLLASDYLSALIEDNKSKKYEKFNQAFTNISDIYNERRSKRLQEIQDFEIQVNEWIEKTKSEINPENKTVFENIKKPINLVKLPFQLFSKGFLNIESLLRWVSKVQSKDSFGGFLFEVTDNYFRAEINRDKNIRENLDSLKKKLSSIYGSNAKIPFTSKKLFGGSNSASQLQKTFEVPVLSKDTEGTDKTEKTTQILSKDEMIYLWMQYQNIEERPSFENAGFTNESMEFIESKLSKKDRDLIQYLFEFYESKYNSVNESYKKLYGVDMPKQKFYAGYLLKEGNKDEFQENLFEQGSNSLGTVSNNSQKNRTGSKNKIIPIGATTTFRRYNTEMEHTVAMTDSYIQFKKVFGDKTLRKQIESLNPNTGSFVLQEVDNFIREEIERGGINYSKSLNAINILHANFVKATLFLKPKIGLTQIISSANTWTRLTQYSVSDLSKGFTQIPKDVKYILDNSEYLKNRSDLRTKLNAISNVESVSNSKSIVPLNPTVRYFFKQFSDTLDKVGGAPIKYGDKIGIMGGTLLFSTAKQNFIKNGMSEADANIKALNLFEASADRTQQTQSSIRKTRAQKNSLVRFLIPFRSSPIQMMGNSFNAGLEIYRKTLGQKSRGTVSENALDLFNYGLVQPTIYGTIQAGKIAVLTGLINALFTGDELEEEEKALASTIIGGNFTSYPIIGSITQQLIDKQILGRKFSYGDDFSKVPALSIVEDLTNLIVTGKITKSEFGETYYEILERHKEGKYKDGDLDKIEKFEKKIISKTTEAIFGVPTTQGFKLYDIFTDYENHKSRYGEWGTIKLALGWSYYTVSNNNKKTKSELKELGLSETEIELLEKKNRLFKSIGNEKLTDKQIEVFEKTKELGNIINKFQYDNVSQEDYNKLISLMRERRDAGIYTPKEYVKRKNAFNKVVIKQNLISKKEGKETIKIE